MSDEKVIPTRDEIRATFAGIRQNILGMDLCLDATIDDYSERASVSSDEWH